MGVIKRQGIKDSIISYVGVAIGAVNTLFIYPYFLKVEELGLFQFMVSAGMLLSIFVALGSSDLITRFFPVFKDEHRKHNGFLFFVLSVPVIGIVILSLFTLILLEPLQHYFGTKETLLQTFWPWLLPLSFFIGVTTVLVNYTKNFLRIAIPTLLENVFVKICTGVISVLLFYSIFDIFGFIIALILTYLAVSIGLVVYLIWLNQFHIRPDFSFINRRIVRQMASFGLYSMLGSFSAGFLTWIDRVMISLLMEEQALKSVGIFSIVAYIGMVIDVPRRSLEKIIAPVVADAFVNDDREKVLMLYRKTSLNQFIVGVFFLLLVWHNFDALLAIMPNGERYAGGKPIVMILGLSAVLTMVAGINHQILTYSAYFKINFYLLLSLAVLNVFFNYLFIRTFNFGIIGAAIATLLSIFIYNLLKFLVIKIKLNMQPFARETLFVALLGLVLMLVFHWVSFPFHPVLDIALKSALISVLFFTPVLVFKWSTEINEFWLKIIRFLR
jgi:O-antigen/teichoic acid export membrane protein